MGRDNIMLKKAYLEISNVCNLSCRFCPGTKREARIMTPAEFHVLAERLRKHTEYLYLHLMGEPLLHPQLEELLGIAAELGFKVIITTNGTLLPERGALLLQSAAVHKVNVSLQSLRATAGTSRRTTCAPARISRRRQGRAGSSASCGCGIPAASRR